MAQTSLAKKFGAISSSLVAAFTPMVAANANAQTPELRTDLPGFEYCMVLSDAKNFLRDNGYKIIANLNYDASRMPSKYAGGQTLITNEREQTLTLAIGNGRVCRLSDVMDRFVRPSNPNDYIGINDLFSYTRTPASCSRIGNNKVSKEPYIPFEVGIQQKIDQGYSMLGYSEWNVRVTTGKVETKYAMFFYKAATGEVIESEAGGGCITNLTYNYASVLNPQNIRYVSDLSGTQAGTRNIALN